MAYARCFSGYESNGNHIRPGLVLHFLCFLKYGPFPWPCEMKMVEVI
jgi:hypothetical protein